MRIGELNWMGLAEYLRADDRVVLPLGVVEQHAFLSLETDSSVAERMALEAAEPLEVVVLPVLAYGFIDPPFPSAYPGTISFAEETYALVLRDILESLFDQGFRRIAILNGHGGNDEIGRRVVADWELDHPDGEAVWHTWLWAPETQKVLHALDPKSRSERRHASWVENFPWTRVEGVEYPRDAKASVDFDRALGASPEEARELIGDGCFGGDYIRSDEDWRRLWRAAVDEFTGVIDSGWRHASAENTRT